MTFAGLMLATIALNSVGGLIAVATHGLVAGGIILAATGLGFLILRILRMGDAPMRWRLILAAALGLGGLSLLMLFLGEWGVMNRRLWMLICAAAAIGGWVPFLVELRRSRDEELSSAEEAPSRFLPWSLLPLALFAGFAMLAASMPPGLLWPAEGGGYDALEYHLGAPRDYLDAGRIAYLPHNIYSNFPFVVEMLYLLAMILHGDPVRAALTCQLIHALLGGLAVAAIWLAGREVNRQSGILSAMWAGSAPFLVYLSGLAYVEHGLMFFSAIALAASIRAHDDKSQSLRWALAAGLSAGLACGCKYTGVTATLLPLLAYYVIWGARRGRRATMTDRNESVDPSGDSKIRSADNAVRPARLHAHAGRWAPLLCFAAGAALTFSPWLIRNVINTGNPVFPLGYSLFGARDGLWNTDLARQWSQGHQPAAGDRALAGRMARLGSQILYSRFFGPVVPLGLMLLLGVKIRRMGYLIGIQRRLRSTDRDTDHGSSVSAERGGPRLDRLLLACGLMIFSGLFVWLFFTHLVDRFAIVLIIPSSVLCGVFADRLALCGARWRVMAWAAPLLTLLFNLTTVSRLLTTGAAEPTAAPLNYLAADAFGRMELMTGVSPVAPPHLARLNRDLRAGRHILLIAEARRFYLERGADYCVVFNRNPFAEAAGRLTPAELLMWLRERHYDEVYVDWAEMRRFQVTYGFWPQVTVELFEQLERAGLTAIEQFRVSPQSHTPYATLYLVPPNRTPGSR